MFTRYQDDANEQRGIDMRHSYASYPAHIDEKKDITYQTPTLAACLR